ARSVRVPALGHRTFQPRPNGAGLRSGIRAAREEGGLKRRRALAGARLLPLDLVGLLAQGGASALGQMRDRALALGGARRLLEISPGRRSLPGGCHTRTTLELSLSVPRACGSR